MKKDFFVGPRKQGIPEFAHDGLGSRWYYLRLFSVAPYKGQPHIVQVYRQIIHQTWDKNLNWINQFAYTDDYEVYNKGEYRTGNGGKGAILESLDDAYKFAAQRFEKIGNLWPIIEDVKLIEHFAMPRLLSVSVP
jgi:hypothetical protein